MASNSRDKKEDVLTLSNNGLAFFKLVIGDKLQLENDRRFKNVRNPFYNDSNPSLSIYQDKNDRWCFKDYGNSSYQGDVFDFAAIFYQLNVNKDFSLILEKMKYDVENARVPNNLSISHGQKTQHASSNKVKEIFLFEVEFSKSALDFWNSFGITSNVLKCNGVKQISGVKIVREDGDTSVKNYQTNMVFAYKRGDFAKIYQPQPKKFWYIGNKTSEYVFGQNYFNNKKAFFIVGGEKDVMTLHSLGYEAICLSSETVKPSKSLIKSFFEENYYPIILYDCDETGKKNAQKLSHLYNWQIADLSAILDNNREHIKDVSDYIKLGLCRNKLRLFLDKHLASQIDELVEEKANSKDVEVIKDSEDLELTHAEDECAVNYKAIPSKVFANLPRLLIDLIEPITSEHKRDLILTSGLSVLSGFLNVSGVYGNMDVYPNLFLFVTAPASAGKGVLRWTRILGYALNVRFKKDFKAEVEIYNSNGKNGERPKRKSVFVSANSSIAALLKQLDNNDGRGIMLETEADALNGVMQNQWGNLSDVLRRCFEFEPLSSLRADDEKTFEIEKPRLSIVLTGTKNQLFDLIPTAQNGLFSRFLFFEFPLVKTWEDPFNTKESFKDHYLNLAKLAMLYYDVTAQNNIEFQLTESQQRRFSAMYARNQNKFEVLLGDDSIASIRRMGNIQFRIAMIISTIRMLDEGKIEAKLLCSDIDFETSELLAVWFLEHTEKIFQQLPNKPKNYKALKTIEAQFFEALPDQFTFKESVLIAENLKIALGTAERFLRKFLKIQLINKLRHGEYCKAPVENSK